MEIFKKTSNVFRILSEAVSEGIIVVNKEQVIVATNNSANELFDYEEHELVGKPLEILIPQKYHHVHSDHVKGFLRKSGKRKMGHGGDLYGQRKDGTTFPVEAGLNPFTIYDNDYVMALITDISVRKKAEEELRDWANIFNESLNEIFIFDATTLKFVNVNRGAQNNIGYSLDELKKLTPVDIKPEYTEEEFRNYIQPLRDGSLPKLTFNTTHQRKDGSIYPVEVHLQPSDANERKTLVAIILDITEQANYTDKLEKTVAERTGQLREALQTEKELNELKTKFLSLVSHEFKTPLSGILTASTLIGKYTETEQQEKRTKHINTIQSKVKYLNNIINDFLSIERLDRGKINYKFSRFSLSKVINEVIYDANMLLKQGQKIVYPDNIDDIVIDFDEKILELILTNLVTNAVKYSPENAIVKVNASLNKDELIVEVVDTGIGIPKAEQKFVFNRYFRAENALLSQGTGIGLNIVKSHLENLGGNIKFTSEQNKGSTFTITIPTPID
ncbi:sensor histidine kinase [Spongiivirga citrea]|uniref:histidine kinase n=1 Tax=Spongiivirga citrea TaxID=1481457 RepID=A0A6M0CLE9_9FLAO|nr:PAS domain-containing sensor histidine kinase [Spongiivirga citrea]NER16834.1 PAS domain S-box protein [Spongiivirga citrea]